MGAPLIMLKVNVPEQEITNIIREFAQEWGLPLSLANAGDAEQEFRLKIYLRKKNSKRYENGGARNAVYHGESQR